MGDTAAGSGRRVSASPWERGLSARARTLRESAKGDAAGPAGRPRRPWLIRREVVVRFGGGERGTARGLGTGLRGPFLQPPVSGPVGDAGFRALWPGYGINYHIYGQYYHLEGKVGVGVPIDHCAGEAKPLARRVSALAHEGVSRSFVI